MRALARRMRRDMDSRPDRFSLGTLADQLEQAVARLHTGITIEHEVQALRDMNAIVTRVCAEYARMNLNMPFEIKGHP
jgi:hypothetical protein